MIGKYSSFAELEQHEVEGRDFRVVCVARPASRVCIVAPHGGMIEMGTSEIATGVAGEDHNLFLFEGLKPYGSNRALHITSHHFDHPDCLSLLSRCDVVIGVHGCQGESSVYLGGLDHELAAELARAFASFDLETSTLGHRYPGRHPDNICNRGARRCGAQIELTQDWRVGTRRFDIVKGMRLGIDAALKLRRDSPVPPLVT